MRKLLNVVVYLPALSVVLALTGRAPAQIVVTSSADSLSATANDGTLRGAILAANAAGSSATITFAVNNGGGNGTTIALAGMLPILTNANGISINGANSGTLGGAMTIDGGSTGN